MIFLERINELMRGILPGKKAQIKNGQNYPLFDCDGDAAGKTNPWSHNLERLSTYQQPGAAAAQTEKTESGETKIQLLMEQARLEKAKEMLKEQQEKLRLGDPAQPLSDKAKRRTTDATIVDAKAWWGQAVATWNPEDAKNLGPQGEIKHPRQHKWFNQ